MIRSQATRSGGAVVGWRTLSAMGSHLSRLAQAGRCRVCRVRSRTRPRYAERAACTGRRATRRGAGRGRRAASSGPTLRHRLGGLGHPSRVRRGAPGSPDGAVTSRSRAGSPSLRRHRAAAGQGSSEGRSRCAGRYRGDGRHARSGPGRRSPIGSQAPRGDGSREARPRCSCAWRPGAVAAGVEEDPVKPGIEAIGIAQGGQVPPASDERLLDGVLRAVRVPQDEPGRGVEPTDRGACQHGEGVMIALPCSLHEVSLHVALVSARPVWSRLERIGGMVGEWFRMVGSRMTHPDLNVNVKVVVDWARCPPNQRRPRPPQAPRCSRSRRSPPRPV